MSNSELKRSLLLNILGRCTTKKTLERLVFIFAFNPPEPSYKINSDDENDEKHFKKILEKLPNATVNCKKDEETDAIISFDVLEWEREIQVKKTKCKKTKRRVEEKKIGHVFITILKPDKPKFTIFYSHGNATDIGMDLAFYISLAVDLNCNVFAYDYSGYGVSNGRPSEEKLYVDSDYVFRNLQSEHGIEQKSIILFGASIGTVPTINLARDYDVAGVILQSPLKSGLELVFPGYDTRTFPYNPFPNIDKVGKIKAPVLVIHGKNDAVVPIEHGIAIYEKCQKSSEPLWAEDDHNINVLQEEYLEKLKLFIKELEEQNG